MQEKLNELYNKIGNHLIGLMIPVEWERVWLLGDVPVYQGRAEAYSTAFYCLESASGEIKRGQELMEENGVENCDELEIALIDMITELHNCFKDAGQELWEQASFCFEKSGAFTIEYFYNVTHKDDGAGLGREIMWAYKTVGYMPSEGSFFREELDELLAKTP